MSNQETLTSQTTKVAPAGMPGKHGHISVEKPKNSKEVLSRLWSYLSKESAYLFLILVLLIINITCTLIGSYLLRPTINNFIIPRNISGLITMILLLLIIYAIGAIAGVFLNRIMILVAQKTISNIRVDLFSKLQSLPLNFFDSAKHGDLMSLFVNDMDNVSDALNASLLQFLTSSIMVIGILSLMLYISPLLTLVTFIIVPFMLWVASAIIKKSKGFFTTQQKALGEVDGYVEEMIIGMKVVKVFCFEGVAEKNFESLNYDLRDKATKAQLYAGVMQPIIQNLNTINFALTATVGGLLAIFKGFDLGGLAAFMQYSRQFGRPVNEISSQYNTIQSALAGAERIFQIMDELAETSDIPGAIDLVDVKGNVEFNGVTFSYDDDKVILKNISFCAKAGQKIALVGSTGAGKTTIMNLLPRFYDIQAGHITIDGLDIMKLKRGSLRKALAIVLQDTHLFKASVMDNIRYGKLEATNEEVIAAAILSGADSFIQRLPKGYHTLLQNDGDNLSQGQRQLLNITRSIVAKPVILILDEATSSIDTRTEQTIQKGVDQLMKGLTCFVIAHRLSTVRDADEILVLDNGEIIERGNHETLLKQKGKYYQLYTSQFD